MRRLLATLAVALTMAPAGHAAQLPPLCFRVTFAFTGFSPAPARSWGSYVVTVGGATVRKGVVRFAGSRTVVVRACARPAVGRGRVTAHAAWETDGHPGRVVVSIKRAS